MPSRQRRVQSKPETKPAKKTQPVAELVIVTGLSGAGKASALKAFEDLGFYSVDNLPVDLLPGFADLVQQSDIRRAAIVIDIREGRSLARFPSVLKDLRTRLDVRVLFLEADDKTLQRRFSETRRPHPFGKNETVLQSLREERRKLAPVRRVADLLLDTTRFNVHELRAHIQEEFHRGGGSGTMLVSCVSFGYRAGVPTDADIVFDVRFLPNPHFIPEFRALTGRHPKVAKYVRHFPQTQEFLTRTSELLEFLLPHYQSEGKSYLTIAFGCTGGQHRSVMIAEEMAKRLRKGAYRVKVSHRDMPR